MITIHQPIKIDTKQRSDSWFAIVHSLPEMEEICSVLGRTEEEAIGLVIKEYMSKTGGHWSRLKAVLPPSAEEFEKLATDPLTHSLMQLAAGAPKNQNFRMALNSIADGEEPVIRDEGLQKFLEACMRLAFLTLKPEEIERYKMIVRSIGYGGGEKNE